MIRRRSRGGTLDRWIRALRERVFEGLVHAPDRNALAPLGGLLLDTAVLIDRTPNAQLGGSAFSAGSALRISNQ